MQRRDKSLFGFDKEEAQVPKELASARHVELDPNGKSLNEPGAKGDAGKVRPAMVLGGFARALKGVCAVGTYGAAKYSPSGWLQVPDAESRYDDAKLRHWLDEKSGSDLDPDTELLHSLHEAWNALARVDLIIRRKESSGDVFDYQKLLKKALSKLGA